MAAPAWIDRGELPAGLPASPYVLWASERPDLPMRRPEGKTQYHICELCGIDPTRQPQPGASMADQLDHILAKDFGRWNLSVPNLLPREVFRPDLRDPPEDAVATGAPPDLGGRLPPNSVFIGVVDDAVAFGHERFRRADGVTSRVDYLWVQGAPHYGDAVFGREYRAHEIAELIAASRRPGGTLDEATLYRRAGLIDMARPEPHSAALGFSHGTAVLDVAGGGLPDSYPLAVVTLPPQVTRDTSGTFAAVFVIAGIRRILQHVERCSAPHSLSCPVIINLSLGLTAGAKDGHGVVEDFLGQVAAQWEERGGRIRFVLPAGNHRLARTRVGLDRPLTPADPPLAWRLLPDDRTPSFLEVWSNSLDRPERPTLSVSLARPGHPEPPAIPHPRFDHTYDLIANGALLARAWFQWRPNDADDEHGPGRERVTLAVPPTAPAEPGGVFVPPGDWRLLVEAAADVPTGAWPVDLFIQRDDVVPGYRSRGRQSRFQESRYTVYDPSGRLETADTSDSYVRRAGTLNSFAAAENPVVVGGCYARDEPGYAEEVAYSGAAFAKDERPWRRQPELTAPCERSRVRRGILAASSRSGGRIAISGTSIAAPAVARRLAEEFAGRNSMVQTTGKLLGLLTDRDPTNPGSPPSLRPGPVLDDKRSGVVKLV